MYLSQHVEVVSIMAAANVHMIRMPPPGQGIAHREGGDAGKPFATRVRVTYVPTILHSTWKNEIEDLSKYASAHPGQHAGGHAGNALVPGNMSKDKIELREAPHYGFLGARMGSAAASSGATTKTPLRDSSAAWDYGLRARMEIEEERSERAARRASSVGSLSARLSTLGARRTDTLKPLTQKAPLALTDSEGSKTLLSRLVGTDRVLTRGLQVA